MRSHDMPPIGAAMVSIVLPTYNRAQFLPAAFASIANQTFTDWELVIVDDGSTDNTADVVRSFEATQPVRCVRQENRGAYAARNRGLDEATGRYSLVNTCNEWIGAGLRRVRARTGVWTPFDFQVLMHVDRLDR